MSWQHGGYQSWQQEREWQPSKGKGKGKDFGKSRPSLGAALGTVRAALDEQAQLAALGGLWHGRGEDAGQAWPPSPSTGLLFSPATPPAATQPMPQGPSPPFCPLTQSVVSSLACGVLEAGSNAGVTVVGTLAGALRTALLGKRGDETAPGVAPKAPPAAAAGGSAGDSLAQRVAAALSDVGDPDGESERDALVRRLTDRVAALQVENRRLRARSRLPARSSSSVGTSARTTTASRTSARGEPADRVRSIVDQALFRAVAQDFSLSGSAGHARAAPPVDASDDEVQTPPRRPPAAAELPTEASSQRQPSRDGTLLEAPAEISPSLHKKFFHWLGSSSTLRSATAQDEWARSAAKKWSATEGRKARAMGLRRVPTSRDAIVIKLLRQHITVTQEEASA